LDTTPIIPFQVDETYTDDQSKLSKATHNVADVCADASTYTLIAGHIHHGKRQDGTLTTFPSDIEHKPHISWLRDLDEGRIPTDDRDNCADEISNHPVSAPSTRSSTRGNDMWSPKMT
jgi:hypothetical protein